MLRNWDDADDATQFEIYQNGRRGGNGHRGFAVRTKLGELDGYDCGGANGSCLNRAAEASHTSARKKRVARKARAARRAKAARAAKLVAAAKNFKSPDVLVLGDSQLAFGSGSAFLNFFKDIKNCCDPNSRQMMDLEQLDEMSVGVISVRSTSLANWSARKSRLKDKVCKVDRKWRSNAATFGTINSTRNKYVQIGQGH